MNRHLQIENRRLTTPLTVTFRFVTTEYGEQIEGFHPSFKKRAFVGNTWLEDRPADGETRICCIGVDTQPGKKTGVFFLRPYIQEDIVNGLYLVTFRRSSKRNGSSLVGTHPAFAKLALPATRWPGALPIAGESVLCQICFDSQPERSNKGIFLLTPVDPKLRPVTPLTSAAAVAPTATPASQVTEATAPTQPPVQHQPLLMAGRDVNITEIVSLQKLVEFVKFGAATGVYKVFVDGVEVGFSDDRSPMRRTHEPVNIKGREITLSNGAKFTVFEKLLTVHPDEDFSSRREIFTDRVKVDLTGKLTRQWSDLATLSLGSVLMVELPFHWQGDSLTNGQLALPRLRPQGIGAWRRLGIPSVPEELWSQFLSGLEGKYLVELLPFHQETLSENKRRKEERALKLTERQEKIKANIQMWSGAGCECVSIGKNVIFKASRPDAEDVYIVDSPSIAALYLFTDYDTARDFATGVLQRTAAIKAGHKRVIHNKGWEERVAKLIATYGIDTAAEEVKAAA